MLKACSSSLFPATPTFIDFFGYFGGTGAASGGCASIYVDADSLHGSPDRLMRRVYLARHGSHAEVGRVLSGRSEIALSEIGHVEAGRLAERLDRVPLGAIYCSPRRRALETAAPVVGRHRLPLQLRAELDEIDFGEWSGRSFDSLEGDARWRDWNARRSIARAPGGETMAEAVARARRLLEGIAEPEALCVTHCDVIRGVVAFYLGLDFDRLLAFDCDPASLTTIEFGPDGARLVTLNERP